MSEREPIGNSDNEVLGQEWQGLLQPESEDGIGAGSPSDLDEGYDSAEREETADDPLGTYLQQIGRVPLLNAEEEKALARDMEEGDYINKLEKKYTQKHMRPPTAIDTAIALLEQLETTMPILEAIEAELGLSAGESLTRRMSRPELRAAVDGQLDDKLIKNVSLAMKTEPDKVVELVKRFSLASSLISPEVLALLVDKTTAELGNVIRAPGFADTLRRSEYQILQYMQGVKEMADKAKNRFVEANTGLAVGIAQNHAGLGVHLDDLIQAGYIGIWRAAERFDYRRGLRFSTYATDRIRGSIIRAIQKQSPSIYTPANVHQTIVKIYREKKRLAQELEREPTIGEIAEQMDMPLEEVKHLLQVSRKPISLESPVGEEGGTSLADMIEDEKSSPPEEDTDDAARKDEIQKAIEEYLNPLEQSVLKLRLGLDDGIRHTVHEVSRRHRIPSSRVRDIQDRALNKLTSPSLRKKLQDLLWRMR